MQVSDDCIFCSIVKGDTESDFLYEDGQVVAFRDSNPAAKFHVLIVPKDHVPALDSMSTLNTEFLAHLLLTAKKLGNEHSSEYGYRVALNGGGAEDVPHLHMHVLGGQADLGNPAKGVIQ